MSDTVITLPSQDEMLTRLNEVESIDHVRNGLFPHLLQHAGEEKVAEGVALMIALAIYDYTEGMPPIMSNLLYMGADKYVDALVVDNSEVAEKAKGILQEALNAAKNG